MDDAVPVALEAGAFRIGVLGHGAVARSDGPSGARCERGVLPVLAGTPVGPSGATEAGGGVGVSEQDRRVARGTFVGAHGAGPLDRTR